MLINSINSVAARVSDFRSGRQKQKINANGTKDGGAAKAKNNWKNGNNGDLHADNWESEFIKDFYIFISGIGRPQPPLLLDKVIVSRRVA